MKFLKITLVLILLIAGVMGVLSVLKSKTRASNISAELQEEVENVALKTTGIIPTWLSGTLIRNGPVTVSVNGHRNGHWFDGLAMLHAFSFHEGEVRYSNRFLQSDAYHTVFDEGSLNYDGFASDPCRSLFMQFLTFLIPSSHPAIQNANVNVAKLADEYVALTEVPLPVRFNRKTLETLGVLDYQDALPKNKCWESAHPHYDVDRKRTLNYLIQYGRTSYYTLYGLEEGSNQRKIIAEVPVEEPAYMHSFAVTENYIILTEFPFVVKPLDLILQKQAFIKNFTWLPEKGTRFIVINKQDGKIVGQYITKPFFAFHHANAFEKEGIIHLDIVTYKDAGIITGDNLHVNSDQASRHGPESQLQRFSLSLKNGEITSDVLLPKSNEFPRINEQLDGKPYRYLYVAGLGDENEDGLYKVNTTTKEVFKWSEKACSTGEPVFVPTPGALDEDDGVVLALVLDHQRNDSFLLILDGKSFKELGRARAPHLIPPGLHGQYF